MVPERILSLVPSLTEALFALGLGEKVVGRTRYCTQPPHSIGKIPKIGGTKKIDVEKILSLEPDLVIAVREENPRESVESLIAAGVPVLLGEPETVAGAVEFLREIAERIEAPKAEAVLEPIERVHERLRSVEPKTRRVFVPIWREPYMSVGSDTFVHDVLKLCGGENICGDAARYPEVSPEEIESKQPEVILLPDEPYPFSAEDLPEFYALHVPAAREDRVHLVDGKLLTWYGPRMASSLTQIAALMKF